MTDSFYDHLEPYYTDFYEDWERAVLRQAAVLDEVIREQFDGAECILDAACGIGTQSIGLAQLGYQVTASDLSAGAVDRARVEAQKHGVDIQFGVADMRDLSAHAQGVDLVIACDNAIPHLLTDADIRTTFEQFYRVTGPRGGCIISVRDYAAMRIPGEGFSIEPRRVIQTPQGKRIAVEVREYSGNTYSMTLYFIDDDGSESLATKAVRGGVYYCVTMDTLVRIMREAGFKEVFTIRERFFQPLIIGKKV
jgi:ubiquinone/menaquinone biosynthesis C-methylase UbiE